MRRALTVILVVALATLSVPWPAAAQHAESKAARHGTIAGLAIGVDERPLVRITIRLRNFRTGDVQRSVVTNANGGFSFIDVPAGFYVAEIVDPRTNRVVGTSPLVTLAPTAMVVSTLVLKATTALATGAGVATANGFFGTTVLGVVLAASAAGVTAAVASSSPICSVSK